MAKSTNAFKSFKDRYIGGLDSERKMTAHAIGQMTNTYEAAYNAILATMHGAKKDLDYATYAKQAQLLKQVAEILDKFKGTAGKNLAAALGEISAYSTKVAIADLALFHKGLTKDADWHREFNEDYANKAFADSYRHIAGQTDKMLGSVKAMLRSEAAQVFRRAAVEGNSRRQAYKELREQVIAADPTFKFTDKAGRAWDSKKYFEMLTRTVMAQTANEVYVNTLTNEGHDLVKISAQGATDACAYWEGRVLSLTGATAGYPTMEQAIASKQVFHPRCRHTVVAYHPDIEEVFQQVKEGKTDDEVLGFNLGEFLKPPDPKEVAKKKLEGLEVDKFTGKPKTPLRLISEASKAKINHAMDIMNLGALETTAANVPISKIRASYPYVSKDLALKYIDDPDAIGAGQLIKAYSIDGQFFIQNSQMKAVAAKLLGHETVPVLVADFDTAYQKKLDQIKAEEAAKAAAKAAAEKAAKEAADKAAKEAAAKKAKELAEKEEFEKSLFNESEFEKVGPQKGSNPGGVYVHKVTGEKYYLKVPPSDDHVKNEVLAAKLYELTGAEVPKLSMIKMGSGRLGIASKWVDDNEPFASWDVEKATKVKPFHEHFAVDAWLANWDVTGLSFDNIAYSKTGKAVRLDVGGSLLFRAQGGAKGEAFGYEVTELNTLIDPGKNPQSAAVFKKINKTTLTKSMKLVEKVALQDIVDAVNSMGFDAATAAKLKQTLFHRQQYIKDRRIELTTGKKQSASYGAGSTRKSVVTEDHKWAFEPPTAEDNKVFRQRWSRYVDIYRRKISYIRKVAPSVTDEEAIALLAYTNGTFTGLNQELRAKRASASKDPALAAYCRLLNSALAKTADTHAGTFGGAKGPWKEAKPEYFIRRTDIYGDALEGFVKEYCQQGQEAVTNSFLSMSRTNTRFMGNVYIYVKPKQKWAWLDGKDTMSVNPGEDEVVFPFGVKVRCLHAIREQGSNVVHVYLEEV